MVSKCKISTDENVEVVSPVKTWFTCHKAINYSYLLLKWKTHFTLICHYSDRYSANSASISFAKTVRIGTKTWRNTCAMSAKSKGKLCLFNYKYHGKGKENEEVWSLAMFILMLWQSFYRIFCYPHRNLCVYVTVKQSILDNNPTPGWHLISGLTG